MKLDPVYVLEPDKVPKMVPTRRAFLLSALSFASGAMVGGACGYSMGASKATPAEPPDPTLEWLRGLADPKSPIADLVANADAYLVNLDRFYSKDELLWGGALRLARELVDNQDIKNRRLKARLLLQMVERNARTDFDPALLAELRRIR